MRIDRLNFTLRRITEFTRSNAVARFVDARNFNLCRLRKQCEFFIINYSHARFYEMT